MKRSTFTDFEMFRATNPQLDGQWLLNGGKEWCWSAELLAAGECQILRCYSHTGLIIEGVGSTDCYGFYVPFKSGVWRNNGIGFHQDEIIVIEPGAEHCETSQTGDGWHGFMVPKHLVAIDPETRGDKARQSYSLKHEQRRTDTVRNLFGQLISAVAENPDIEFSPAARMVEAELRELLVPVLGMDEGLDAAPGRPRISRKEIIRRSHRVLEKFGNAPLHVSQLPALVGVTERTLRRAFNEYYGIGPRQYLQLRQLHKVRSDLLDTDPDDTKVTDILMRWGVWDFGRFSGRYKLQFGELPKQTLQRKSGRKPVQRETYKDSFDLHQPGTGVLAEFA